MGTYCTHTTLDVLMVGTEFDNQTRQMGTICISQAESEINKMLGGRYDVASFLATATAVPPQVRTLCEWLSQALMYNQLGRGQELTDKNHDTLWEKAMANLEAIQTYKVPLVDTVGALIPERSNATYRIQSTTKDYTDTFAEDHPVSWEVDPDKLDDISDERDD